MKQFTDIDTRIPWRCWLFGLHRWSFWEIVGVNLDNHGYPRRLAEKICGRCGKQRRKWFGWATMAEVNQETHRAMALMRNR